MIFIKKYYIIFIFSLWSWLIFSCPLYAESPREMAMEIKFGPYYPEIDKEFSDADSSVMPFQDMFGSDAFLLSQLELDYLLWNGFGTIGIGGTIGYLSASGNGLYKNGEKAADSTSLSVVPLSLSVIYRFDYLAQRFSFPLAFYVKGGFDYYMWWIKNGVDKVARYDTDEGGNIVGMGGIFGGHFNAGIEFLIDTFAPSMAKTFDNEIGVNNTYLFVEYLAAYIDNFGSKSSMKLGDRTFIFGMMFEF